VVELTKVATSLEITILIKERDFHLYGFTELDKRRLRNFADERDWDQFHSPKNLAMALIVEQLSWSNIFSG